MEPLAIDTVSNSYIVVGYRSIVSKKQTDLCFKIWVNLSDKGTCKDWNVINF